MATTGFLRRARILSGSAPASTIRSLSGACTTKALTSKPPMSRGTRSISATKSSQLSVDAYRGAVAGNPADVVDVGDAPDLAYDLLDVRQARGLEREPREGCPVFDRVHPRREYAHSRVGDDRGNVLEETHAVQRLDEDLHRKQTSRRRHPLDLGEALRVARLQGPCVRAPCRVHHDPTPQRHVPYDVFSGHRAAAAG